MVDASFPSRLGEGLAQQIPDPTVEKLHSLPDVENAWDAAASEGGFSMSKSRNVVTAVCAVFAAMLLPCFAQAQPKAEAIPYGANPAAGHYLRVDDANIYYETYGSGGTPLVLLHG
jgi:hypothetical protein